MSNRFRASLGRRALTGVAAAVLGLTVTACGASGGKTVVDSRSTFGTVLFGSLPTAGTPQPGGRVRVGQITGRTPLYIFPIMPPTVTGAPTLNMIASLFLPLYSNGVGAEPTIDYSLSVAKHPHFSDDDRTVTIPLKRGLHWANGATVDANDVLFDIALLKAAVKQSAANWGGYTPGLFPVDVASATASNQYTVVLRLTHRTNPGYFLNEQLQDLSIGVYPLPSTAWNVDSTNGAHLTDWANPHVAGKIYSYLAKAGGKVSTFASNPLWQDVDGPFRLKAFNVTNSSYDLVPSRTYGLSPKPTADVSYQTFTSSIAELTALKAGTLDVDPTFDASALGQAAGLRSSGITVFGGPPFAWSGGTINFKDRTAHFDKVISQRYVREAIAHLIDQSGLIKGVYKDAAVPTYGPVPSQPRSPFAPANARRNPFPYSPAAAVSLLRDHGWHVSPGGQTTCTHPGTGSGHCGAGIPGGTPLRFTWATEPQAFAPSSVLTAEVISSAAKRYAGITIAIVQKPDNFLFANYNDANPAASSYTNDWGVGFGGVSNGFYPTQEGVFNPGGPYNSGAYSDPKATRLMSDSTRSGDSSAVTAEASYLETHIPAFFLPDQDLLIAVSKRVGGSPDSWLALTQYFQFPQFWYERR